MTTNIFPTQVDLTMDPELHALVRARFDDLTARFPLCGHVEIKEIDWQDVNIMAYAGKGCVIFNLAHWNPEGVAKYQKDWDRLVVDSSPTGTITHEFGHVLMKQVAERDGVREAWDRVYPHIGIENENQGIMSNRGASPYGCENASEFVAEAFAALVAERAEAGVFSDQALLIAQTMWADLLVSAPQPVPKPARARRKAPAP